MAQLDKLESLLQRLEAAVTRIEKAKGGSSGAADDATGDAERVTALDEWYTQSFKPWLDLCRKIGGLLNNAADTMQAGHDEVRRIVKVASLSKKPKDDELASLFGALGKLIQQADDFAAKNRGDFFDHLKGIAEGIKALSWVAMPTAVSHVKESVPSVQFYTNKVLVKFRKTDQTQVDWVNAFKKWQDDLAVYVKEHHLTGLAWNPQGKSLAEAASGASAPAAKPAAKPVAASAGSPPPPPPPISNEVLFKDVKPVENKANMADLFAQINNGNVTSGLKKVSDDMKSKNRKDRSGLVAASSVKKTVFKGNQVQLGPPKFELVDKKWVIENQDGNQDLVIDNADMRQTVYVSKCRNSVINVKGKINAISLDGCHKTGIVFENAVASVEIVNCQSVQVQVLGKVPTVIIDKTDGAQIILSKDSFDTVIVSGKSSEMNICTPRDDEFDEVPIPEQYETIYDHKLKKFVTKPTSHASA